MKRILFLALVLAPTAMSAWYLFAQAADQYASRTAFAVRSVDTSPTTDFLGIISSAAGDGGEHGLILYDYLRSQQMVRAMDARLDLEEIYNRAEADWVFSLGRDRSIEDKTFYWSLAISVAFDNASRVIEVETRAFTPEDAQTVAEAVVETSGLLVNRISAAARLDAVRYAEEDVTEAETRLKAVRLELARFRDATQDLDPTESARLAAGLVASLEQKLAELNAELRSLLSVLSPEAPPVQVQKRRIASLEAQIAEETAKLASDEKAEAGGATTLSEDLSRFEELSVERQFAETLYTAALNSLSQARAESRRNQLYLATHIQPTLAEEAEYPRSLLIVIAVFVSGLLSWGVILMVAANIQDRT